MIYTHTIGRIGAKDCRVITGTHGTFMAVDIAVDDYSKGKQITTWVRVKSSKENHIRLAEYLTKGRMVLVEGTLTSSIWTDRNGENHIQHAFSSKARPNVIRWYHFFSVSTSVVFISYFFFIVNEVLNE